MSKKSSQRRRAAQAPIADCRPLEPLASLPARLPHLNVATAVSGLIALAVYAATLNPTVAGGDSGEMIAAAHTLGVAHPPGYPLYTLLAKLFALLPLGSVAARINFFSAVCDAAAAALLCRATALLARNLCAGYLAASLFAFSPLVWPYAVTAEVFALNNAFTAALLLLVTLVFAAVEPGRRWRLFLAGTFVFGLGLTNHHVLVLLAGPVLFMTALSAFDREHWSARRVGECVVACALGLTPYFYLLVAPQFGSEIAWGDTGSLAGFLNHVLRREYGTLQLAESASATQGSAAERLAYLASRLTSATAGLLPALLVCAVPALARRSAARLPLRVWTVGVAVHLLVFATLSNLSVREPIHAAVQERFWQQAVLLLATLAGVGLAQLAGALPRLRTTVLVALGLLAPLALAATHFQQMSQRGHTFFRDYGRALLDSLPPDSLLLITSDEAIGSVRYLQQIEGLRRDVTVLPTGQVASPWFRALAAQHFAWLRLPSSAAGGPFPCRAFLDLNLPHRRVFLVNKIPWLITLEEAYSAVPVGLADEVLPKGQHPPLSPWVDAGLASLTRFDPSRARVPAAGAWEPYVARNYWRQFERFGLAVSSAAASQGGDPDAAAAVVRALAPIARDHPQPSPAILRNLGVAYQYLSRRDPSARQRMVAAWKRYLELAPARDPDRATIARAVQQAEASQPGQP